MSKHGRHGSREISVQSIQLILTSVGCSRRRKICSQRLLWRSRLQYSCRYLCFLDLIQIVMTIFTDTHDSLLGLRMFSHPVAVQFIFFAWRITLKGLSQPFFFYAYVIINSKQKISSKNSSWKQRNDNKAVSYFQISDIHMIYLYTFRILFPPFIKMRAQFANLLSVNIQTFAHE